MDTKKLRQKILDLAIRGKLVPQDPNDEPASVLLERIKAEKEKLIKEGKIKKSKQSASVDSSPYEKLPKGWEWCTLNDLAVYKKGPFGSSLTKAMFVSKSENTYKVYEQKNAIEKDASIGHYYISTEKFKSLNNFEVFPGDILVSCAGTIGETYVLPSNIHQGIINQALMFIRLYNPLIKDFYLLYFDYVLKIRAAKESKGTAIKNIPPFDVLKAFKMPLPPIKEQFRIISEVKRLFALIDEIEEDKASLEEAIKQAKRKVLELAVTGKLCDDNRHYRKVTGETRTFMLEELLDYEQPQSYIVKSTDYSDDYPIPVLTAGKSFILGRTDEKFGIYHKVPAVIFDDFTTDSKYVDFPFKVKSSAMKILKPKNNNICLRYIAAFMSITRLIGKTHKRYWISEYSKLRIVLPPYEEQLYIVNRIDEIFSVLDKIQKNFV